VTAAAGSGGPARRIAALRLTAGAIVQTAVAAGSAWWIAVNVLDHPKPFFAPLAATIALGLAPGYRTRRAVEMVVGVALGIAVGDALISAIGTGTLQVALVVLLAMSAAVLLGGGGLVVSQAATSAVLVATLLPPSQGGLVPTRFLDTLLGGVVGLVVLVIAPGNPLRTAWNTGAPVLTELAGALDDIAGALERRDHAAAQAALGRARAIDGPATAFSHAIAQGHETVRLAPTHRRSRDAVDRLAAAAPHIDHAVRNTRVLARAARRAVDVEPSTPAELPAAIRMLAEVCRTLLAELIEGRPATAETERLLDAAGRATRALGGSASLSAGAIAGQVRSIALDLLRALGADYEQAVRHLRRAAATPA
jgi:Fusaric acid resistance protein-like